MLIYDDMFSHISPGFVSDGIRYISLLVFDVEQLASFQCQKSAASENPTAPGSEVQRGVAISINGCDIATLQRHQRLARWTTFNKYLYYYDL